MANGGSIHIRDWDTVIAVDGPELRVFVRGVEQTNITGLHFRYDAGEYPELIIERVPVNQFKKGAE